MLLSLFDISLANIGAGVGGVFGLFVILFFLYFRKYDWLKGMNVKLRAFFFFIFLVMFSVLGYGAFKYGFSNNTYANFSKVYEGTIDQIPVVLKLSNSEGTISGTEYYKEIGKDIIITGSIEGNGDMTFWEQWPSGAKQAEFNGILNGNSITGIWKHLKTGKNRTFNLLETSANYEAFR